MKVFAAAAIAGVTAAQSIETAAFAYAKQVQQEANAMYKLNEALIEAQDALKTTHNLHREVCDENGYCYEEKTAWEEAMEVVDNKLAEYGAYDVDVESWKYEKKGAWTDLIYEQDKQSTEMAQNDIKEAAAYLKPIFDNMVADLKKKSAEAQIEIADELDSQVAELKESIDTQSAENIEELENWFNSAYDAVNEATDMSYDDIRNATALNMGRFADLEQHFNTVNSLKRRNRKEVIDFVAESSNTNGVSLQALYGDELDDFSAWLDATYDKFEKANSNLKRRNKNKNMQSDKLNEALIEAQDALKTTYNLHREVCDENGFCYEEKTAWEEFMDVVDTKLIEYGADYDVEDEWIQEKRDAWTDLMYEQDKQSTEMAQNDAKEAAAYLKGIFDNMVVDLKKKSAEAQIQIADELDSKVADIKDSIDRQSAENIEEIQSWFDSAYEAVNEATDMSYDDIRNATVGFASVHEGASAASNYGYGILAIGAAAATAAVLYKKRQQKVQSQAGEADRLLEDDEEFQMV